MRSTNPWWPECQRLDAGNLCAADTVSMFQECLNLSQWIKTLTQTGKPDSYVRMILFATVRVGNTITIDYPPTLITT